MQVFTSFSSVRFQILILASYSLICCGCVQKQQSHSFEQIPDNEVPIVMTSEGPLYEEPPFRLEYVLSVEQSEQTPASLLRRPDDFAPGPNNTLVVVEGNDGRVIVYDMEGRFKREIGSQGAGPGQFSFISNMSVVGDSLFFYDSNLRRITSLGVDGSILSVSSVRDYGQQGTVAYLPGGILTISDRSLHYENDLVYQSVQLSVISFATGDILTSISTGPVLYGEPIVQDGETIGGREHPLLGSPVAIAINNQMLLLTTGERPIIDLFDIRGQISKRIRLELQPRPVTQRMKDEYWTNLDIKRSQLGGRPLDPSFKAEANNKIFPKDACWWRSIIADDAGYLWLEDVVSNSARIWYQPSRFFVIDPDGRYLGNVELPSHHGRIRDGLFYALVRNLETDVVEPTIYRIMSNLIDVEYP